MYEYDRTFHFNSHIWIISMKLKMRKCADACPVEICNLIQYMPSVKGCNVFLLYTCTMHILCTQYTCVHKYVCHQFKTQNTYVTRKVRNRNPYHQSAAFIENTEIKALQKPTHEHLNYKLLFTNKECELLSCL